MRGGAEAAGAREAGVGRPLGAWITLSAVIAAAVGVWVLTGFTTSSPSLCSGCHVETVHSGAPEGRDPHSGVACVSCHERDGVFGRYVSNVPARVAHLADRITTGSSREGYGRVTRSACASCHAADIASVTLDRSRGLRMSHAEPLAASAGCLDCHRLEEGVVGSHNASMRACVRCHDSETAASDCSTCHDRQAGAAARARSTELASAQVSEVRCGGCHDEERSCDPCHGTRMPHTREFMSFAHARAAAVDFWYDGGETCSKCHTDTRRPCARCHESMLGRGHPPSLARWHQVSEVGACSGCHQRWAYNVNRDFCADLCHTPEAIEGSPR